MKKVVIIALVVLGSLIIIFNSDSYQEKYYPENYYTKKVKKLEADLIASDKSIQFHYEMFKSAEKSAQKDYNEYLQILYKTEPDESRDSLKTKAKKFISDHVLRFATMLQKVIDERNEIHRKLEETKERLTQIKKSKGKS